MTPPSACSTIPGKDVLTLLEPEPLDVEVRHPDAPRVMGGVLAIVGGDTLGEPLEEICELARRGHQLRSSNSIR